MTSLRYPTVAYLLGLLVLAGCHREPSFSRNLEPGSRPLLDAHNCYPHKGLWTDRIKRALGSGLPLAIEQDLCWEPDPVTGAFRSIVTHGGPFRGNEPTLEDHFFRRVEPIMKKALADGPDKQWPLIILNLEFKNGDEAHVRFVWQLLKSHEHWLTTARRTDEPSDRQLLRPGPMLVLLGGGGAQDKVFYDEVKPGEKLLAFAAVGASGPDTRRMNPAERWKADAEFPPDQMVTQPADNYHRWWNNSWYVIEAGGAMRGGDWTEAEAARLRTMTAHAHKLGYWIRFYTVNGHAFKDGQAWSPDYNTGSLDRAQIRWRAEAEAGVDFIASDMYEEAAKTIREAPGEKWDK